MSRSVKENGSKSAGLFSIVEVLIVGPGGIFSTTYNPMYVLSIANRQKRTQHLNGGEIGSAMSFQSTEGNGPVSSLVMGPFENATTS